MTLVQATMLVAGNMIGSGIFLLPVNLASVGGIAVFAYARDFPPRQRAALPRLHSVHGGGRGTQAHRRQDTQRGSLPGK